MNQHAIKSTNSQSDCTVIEQHSPPYLITKIASYTPNIDKQISYAGKKIITLC